LFLLGMPLTALIPRLREVHEWRYSVLDGGLGEVLLLICSS
jgi:hypothetical protein